MRIVIVGAGQVGAHLAKLLSKEEQEIVLVDDNAEKLVELDANYNLMTMQGSPTSFDALKSAGTTGCDLFIAVTPYETTNVTSCAMAKTLGAKKTVARIDNYEFMKPENKEFFTRIGVDSLIYPEYLAAQGIITALRRTWVRNWFELHDGEIILVGVKLRENARLIGMQLKELASATRKFHVSAIRRNHETIIPRGDDAIEVNDILYFTTTYDYIPDLIEICGKTEHNVKKVMIMGGSRIAVCLANLAQDEFDIKIIENDINVCRKLPEECPNCDIVLGDARDAETLREEGIGDADAFVALSSSSEANILACLTAKEFGINKSIAEVEDIQFVTVAEGLNIGTIINKKLLASSRIFQIMLDDDASTSKCLAMTDAEVAEIEVKPNSKITRAAVKDLKLSRDMTIAGMVRDGKGYLVDGNTVIKAGDFVVVFCLSGAIHKVEKLFN